MAKEPTKQNKLGTIEEDGANFNFNVWKDRKLEVMEEGLKHKFDQNPRLKQFLLDTQTTVLLEANPKDKFWGVGMSLRNPNIRKNNSWHGKAQNHLGRLLSELRRTYKR